MDNKEEGIILNSEDSGETLEVAHFTGRSKQRLKQGLSLGMISLPQKTIGNIWRHFFLVVTLGMDGTERSFRG